MSEAGWSLDPQLRNDTTPVGDLALCRVLSINDADYPWLILVPQRPGVSGIRALHRRDPKQARTCGCWLIPNLGDGDSSSLAIV
jgi:hypothetical protein